MSKLYWQLLNIFLIVAIALGVLIMVLMAYALIKGIV